MPVRQLLQSGGGLGTGGQGRAASGIGGLYRLAPQVSDYVRGAQSRPEYRTFPSDPGSFSQDDWSAFGHYRRVDGPGGNQQSPTYDEELQNYSYLGLTPRGPTGYFSAPLQDSPIGRANAQYFAQYGLRPFLQQPSPYDTPGFQVWPFGYPPTPGSLNIYRDPRGGNFPISASGSGYDPTAALSVGQDRPSMEQMVADTMTSYNQSLPGFRQAYLQDWQQRSGNQARGSVRVGGSASPNTSGAASGYGVPY